MRRWLSILLVLFFGLWPLTGTLEASDDARLPPCCRRHGTHHCAMAMQMAAMMAQEASGSTPMLTAPMTCPLYPRFDGGEFRAVSCIGRIGGEPAGSAGASAQLRRQPRAAARMRPIRTHAGRGPPASTPELKSIVENRNPDLRGDGLSPFPG